MSIAANFPAIKPSLLLDFANTKALDPRITFTRAATAVYYDGVTTAMAEQNLLLQSQAFGNAAWANLGTTETDNAATAPDGTTTAATLNDGTDTGGHGIGSQGPTITAGVTYTASAFFKDVDRQFVILACSTGPNTWASAKFDLTAGTAGSTSTSGAGWSVTSSSITSVGNSWFRCTLTFVSGTSAGGSVRLGMATDGTTFTAGQRGLESYTGSNKTIQIWGAQLEQRSTATAYTPTTTQPITNYVPVLQTAASGAARFDHNPTTGESLGLLIEEQRTNLLTYSAQFDNAAWVKSGLTVTADSAVAPDGTQEADSIVPTTANTSHFLDSIAISFTSGTAYTQSVYAKALGTGGYRVRLRFNAAAFTSILTADFDLNTGTVTAIVGVTATITPVGNGWYRCTATATATATASSDIYMLILTSNGGQAYAGDGFSGALLWGAQLEAGAFPTSYIPTVASQVTRAADAASMTGVNFSSWYRQDEGTIYVDWSIYQFVAGVSVRFTVSDGSTSNQLRARLAPSGSTQVRHDVTSAGVTSTLGSPGVLASINKEAFAFAANNYAGVLNGGAASTSVSLTLPIASQITIGGGVAAVTPLNGHIRKLSYYPIRVTNTQLQALTS